MANFLLSSTLSLRGTRGENANALIWLTVSISTFVTCLHFANAKPRYFFGDTIRGRPSLFRIRSR